MSKHALDVSKSKNHWKTAIFLLWNINLSSWRHLFTMTSLGWSLFTYLFLYFIYFKPYFYDLWKSNFGGEKCTTQHIVLLWWNYFCYSTLKGGTYWLTYKKNYQWLLLGVGELIRVNAVCFSFGFLTLLPYQTFMKYDRYD